MMAVIPLAAMSIGYFPKGVKLIAEPIIITPIPRIKYNRRFCWTGSFDLRYEPIRDAILYRINPNPGIAGIYVYGVKS